MPLDTFSLEGAARADLRHPHRRAKKDGARVRGRAARERRRHHAGAARGVRSLARREEHRGEALFPGLLRRALSCAFRFAVVRRAGAIVAFANIWRAGADTVLSADLMRYSDAAPKGVIDFMLVECMLWGKAQHYQWFSLGMAPLSGLEEHALAPAWHKLGRMVQRYGETFYPFEGLRKYKEKFLPVWRPRYLAAPGGLGHGGRVARCDLAHLRRRQQGVDQVAPPGMGGERLLARRSLQGMRSILRAPSRIIWKTPTRDPLECGANARGDRLGSRCSATISPHFLAQFSQEPSLTMSEPIAASSGPVRCGGNGHHRRRARGLFQIFELGLLGIKRAHHRFAGAGRAANAPSCIRTSRSTTSRRCRSAAPRN